MCTSALCARLRICNLEKALRIRCPTWYRHVQKYDSWISKITDFEIAGKKRKGRPSKTWEDRVMKDVKNRIVVVVVSEAQTA